MLRQFQCIGWALSEIFLKEDAAETFSNFNLQEKKSLAVRTSFLLGGIFLGNFSKTENF